MREGTNVLVLADPHTLDAQGIRRSLPHRYPMLLVDRVDHLEEGYIEGIKCVTVNEPYLVGHFPDYPIFPGVLIVDALAQVAGIMLRAHGPKPLAPEGARLGVLAAIQRMRFLQPVLPGDQLRLRAWHVKTLANAHQVKVEARVGDTVVAKGDLVVAS